jgi:hypothetical protein
VHYVIVRADLPHGSQVAQAIHAAGETASVLVKPGTVAVALHARDQEHLREISTDLTKKLIPHHVVQECDGEWMAIGILPTTDRKLIRKATSSLPLVK